MVNTWEGCYSEEELKKLGIKFGKNVLVSKNAKLYNPKKLVLGDNVRIDDFCILTGDIKIGNFVHIAAFCLLSGRQKIIIGNFVGIAARTSIYTRSSDFTKGMYFTNPMVPEKFVKTTNGKVVLKDHVLIGANSVILPSAYLDEGIVTGSFSLVKGKKYPKWNCFVGIPIKKIKPRPSKFILRDAKKILQKKNN